MFDPTSQTHQNASQRLALSGSQKAKWIAKNRKGAIASLFSIILPILMILCGVAINLAYMQMVTTELKIASDCASHAGGRAMSVRQDIDEAIAYAQQIAEENKVAGTTISISTDENAGGDDHLQVQFGQSARTENGYGKYEFSEVTMQQISQESTRTNSVAVVGRVELPLVFRWMNAKAFGGSMSHFSAVRRSVATQVDRDIALVLDRSGSMLYFKDDDYLSDTLEDIYNTYDTVVEPGYWKYGCWKWSRRRGWRWKGYYKPEDAHWSWDIDWDDKEWEPESTQDVRRISSSEYSNATKSLYSRTYSNNVIYQLERWENDSHTLGDSFSSSERLSLDVETAQYCADWQYTNQAARHSRWYFLDLGVTKFLDILEDTDQDELVSLVTFSSTSRVDYALQENYGDIRTKVAAIVPNGGTAIGDGMLDGLPPIVDGEAARPFAAKTIVVLTDGDNNAGEDPEDAVEEIIEGHNVTIHTVTFSEGANQDPMKAVAAAGFGRHYHANDGDVLVEIFEEIANNLPTILTE